MMINRGRSLWTTERFVEEVEQVRKAIGGWVISISQQFVGGLLGMDAPPDRMKR
jgi:hypothetical protein